MSTPAIPSPTNSRYWFSLWAPRLRAWGVLYVLLLPTIISMGIFGYYPKIDVVIKSMYRWQPEQIQEFIGLKNFTDAFADPIFWQSFQLVGILLVTNLVKMWPSIFAAIALHRLVNPKSRYFYQVMFVIPMVIPQLVMLLIWKSFYDPDFGILNKFLNLTGLMHVLYWLDGTADAPGLMPKLADIFGSVQYAVINPLAGSAWGLLLFGVVLLHLGKTNVSFSLRKQYMAALVAMAVIPILWYAGIGASLSGSIALLGLFFTVLVLFARRTSGAWLLWALWFISSLFIFQEHAWRFLILLVVAFALNELFRRRLTRIIAADRMAQLGWVVIGAASTVILLGNIWTEPTGQFIEGTPAWLGNKDLVIPAVIFWGFPWVGVVGVLIYLAGLQQISQDVYEAAELDGVGPIGMMFRIELPLILTQVRINLIFMTIGTLTQYEFFLLLLGTDGGPGNKGMVPGLYMFKKAFEDGHFGYACALGMVLFVLILGLTIIYNRYVKVEK